MGTWPGKLCGFEGPRIASPLGRSRDRPRSLSRGRFLRRWTGEPGREGARNEVPALLQESPGAARGGVRGSPAGLCEPGGQGAGLALPLRARRTAGQSHLGVHLRYPSATPAPRTFPETEVQSARLWEDSFPPCAMGQVSYLMPLNLGFSSIKLK